jgi:hypothetical protein
LVQEPVIDAFKHTRPIVGPIVSPIVGAIAGFACIGCRLAAGTDTGADAGALPASQQSALEIARNSSSIHRAIAEVIQFIGQGLAPNMGGKGPFGGAAWPSVIAPDGGLNPSRPSAVPAEPIVLAAPPNCSVTTQAVNGQFALHDDCTLSSGRHVFGAMSSSFGGACGFNGMQVSIDFTVAPTPGSAELLHLHGTLGLSFQVGRLYVSSALDFDASFGDHAIIDHARDCVVVDWPARAFAFEGATNHSIDGAVVLLAAATDVQQSMCEPAPYAGQFQIVASASALQVTFSQPDPATELIAVGENGMFNDLRLASGAFPGCGAPSPKLEIDYGTCGSCTPPPPPTSPPLDH